ncbi:MAG: hypothetical protein IKU39_01220 [Lachnospiraceae bacterium]|nr:hypothetical protein [Lachnospiraceae bacterium]
MSLTINASMTNYIENGKLFTEKGEQGNRKSFFAGNSNLVNDPIAQKRKEAQEKAWKVVSDAWDADKKIDKSIEDRQNHYNEMVEVMKEAQSHLKDINDQIDVLKEEYGVTEETEFKDWPDEYKQRYFELYKQASEFKNQIYDADKLMKDDVADIKAIALERLKSDPMADAQKTVEAIEEAANKEIIGMAMQQAKDHIDEKMEEEEEKAEEKAEEEEAKEEKLELQREIKELQKAIAEGTKEAVKEATAEAEARRQENEALDLPLDELIKLTQMNTETDKAQKSLDEIKYSMNLLEADLKGIEIDKEI